jgi:ribosomal protein S18 acetylase RimI-like enzyme
MVEERSTVSIPSELITRDRQAGIGEVSETPVDLNSGNNRLRLSESDIFLRPANAFDEAFMYATFVSTRIDELAVTGWSEEQKQNFLRMQFEAQRQSYLRDIPDAEYSVIQWGTIPVGRLIVEQTPLEIHIVDIALLSQFRKLGIGSILMRRIFAEAEEIKRSVRLFVERFNPALRWYEGMGFEVASAGPIYLEMIWRAVSSDLGSSSSQVA